MAIQSDGKIVVAGTTANPLNFALNAFAVVRYNGNGTLDASFNGVGTVTTDFGASGATANSMVIQSDGKIVVVGNNGFSPNGIALARYNTNGSLDTGFGTTGTVILNFGATATTGVGVALQSNGKILVAGTFGTGNASDFLLLRYEGLPLAPEIAVEQPAGTDLVDGAASVDFGNVLTGATVSKTFTIKNTGGADLSGLGITFDGTDAATFTVTASPTAPVSGPNGSTTFTVRFAPALAGAKTAALHIVSNDADENPFDIALTGRALAPLADDDGDGLSNAAELNLTALGFDPLVNNGALLLLLRNNGLYQASDLQTLALGNPVLAKDSLTGHFHLSIGILKSPNLGTFTPLFGFSPTYDAPTGRIDIEITPDGSNAQFYRVLGTKP